MKRPFDDPDLAREAGRKGGLNKPAAKRAFSLDRELAIRAGKKGGQQTARKKAAACLT